MEAQPAKAKSLHGRTQHDFSRRQAMDVSARICQAMNHVGWVPEL